MKSTSVNAGVGLAHRRWPSWPAGGQVHLPSPSSLPFLLFSYHHQESSDGTSRQSWSHPQEANLWHERSTALTNHRNPAFSSCPAVLATALNYSSIVSFPLCLIFFRCDRAKGKTASIIFKSKRKFKLFIAKFRAHLHNMFPIYIILNNFLLSFIDKTIIQTDKLWTVILLCFSLQCHALNQYSLPLV